MSDNYTSMEKKCTQVERVRILLPESQADGFVYTVTPSLYCTDGQNALCELYDKQRSTHREVKSGHREIVCQIAMYGALIVETPATGLVIFLSNIF